MWTDQGSHLIAGRATEAQSGAAPRAMVGRLGWRSSFWWGTSVAGTGNRVEYELRRGVKTVRSTLPDSVGLLSLGHYSGRHAMGLSSVARGAKRCPDAPFPFGTCSRASVRLYVYLQQPNPDRAIYHEKAAAARWPSVPCESERQSV